MLTSHNAASVLAPVVGAGFAITASTAVPLSAALAAGVLLTMALREVFDIDTHSTLSVGILVLLVGIGLFVRVLLLVPVATEPLVTRLGDASSARLLIGLAVGGLLLHELFVRVDEVLDAGSTDAAGRHRLWTGPTTFVVMCVALGQDLGVDRFTRPLAVGAVLLTVCFHSLLVGARAPEWLTVLALSLSIVSLFGFGAVADGTRPFDGSDTNSVFDGLRRFWG